MGRKWIQIQGFLLAALFREFRPRLEDYPLIHPRSLVAVLAGKFTTLSTAGYRATAHGLSAAFGKLGAIVSALAFNTLTKKIGTPAVLWSESCFFLVFHFMINIITLLTPVFFGCCIAGAGFTLLLPEVKGRDPDLVLAEEMREAREQLPA
ncbi:hypothetical protein C0989_001436 [Termitomyces sp. Mn162]|nr:hypothetical protein C0989_001436 [Termitomyces sp. Mn162]